MHLRVSKWYGVIFKGRINNTSDKAIFLANCTVLSLNWSIEKPNLNQITFSSICAQDAEPVLNLANQSNDAAASVCHSGRKNTRPGVDTIRSQSRDPERGI